MRTFVTILALAVVAGCGSDGVLDPTAVVRTFLLRDINPGPSSSSPGEFTSLGRIVVFVAHDTAHGSELWRTDGTPQGTRLVKDVDPGPSDGSAGSSSPYWLTRHGNVVFFAASDAAHGNELWRSDGTDAGTVLVKDINPGPDLPPIVPRQGSSYPREIVSVGGFVAFRACDEAYGPELWRSDGTDAGTLRLTDIVPGPGIVPVSGTTCLGETGPFDLVGLRGLVYFFAEHPTFGTELWRSDGTPEGTWMVTEVIPGPDPPQVMRNSGVPVSNLVATEDRLFFNGPGGLWTSDGTADGTRRIGPPTALLTAARSRAFFYTQSGLGVSDGTTAGTRQLAALHMAISIRFGNRLSRIVPHGDVVAFDASDEAGGYEPWRSDGTPEGTMRLADLAPGSPGSDPVGFVWADDRSYFFARAGGERHSLWSVGTSGPLRRESDRTIEPSCCPRFPTMGSLPGILLLSAVSGPEGAELWAHRTGQ